MFRYGLLEKEYALIHDLLLNSSYEFSGIENILKRLIKVQHYGLPTKLLDITTNPLVTLVYTCSKDLDEDWEIIVIVYGGIPQKEKGRLRKELETFGINQAFLFPELEYQATYIKYTYRRCDSCHILKPTTKMR